ncbi:MAG TPA: ABC transporter ATP-binding protein [Candidatus Limnocylindria bacterium]|nr:ABC transporter ATP-binding protein [Candidatus Limnocylindria bacterium]
MAEIRLERVSTIFGKVRAVDDVELTINHQEFVVLLGPSGCGKTTLLRSVAGLESIHSGRILLGGREVTDLPPRKRDIAMVFQSYAVFPHLTVFENIAFGLRMKRIQSAEVKRRVESAAELLHIGEFLQRHPAQLSGGQRQRVAVARAIAMESGVILMDEPLSNLDALLRVEMRAELKRLLREIKATTIYVTHDQVEALSMGDRIAVMRAGKVVQVGNPLEVYSAPADRFVGSFIGDPPMNFLTAELERDGGRLTAVVAGGGRIPLDEPSAELAERVGEGLVAGIRAENIEVARQAADAPGNGVVARCLVVEPLGSHNLLTLALGDTRLKAITRPDYDVAPDEDVALHIDARRIRWLDSESGLAIGPPPQAGSPVPPA